MQSTTHFQRPITETPEVVSKRITTMYHAALASSLLSLALVPFPRVHLLAVILASFSGLLTISATLTAGVRPDVDSTSIE